MTGIFGFFYSLDIPNFHFLRICIVSRLF